MEPFLGLDSRSAVCRINADTVRFPAEADTSVRQSNVARRNRRIATQCASIVLHRSAREPI